MSLSALRRKREPCHITSHGSFLDSLLEESGFEPLVPLQNQHNRGTRPMSPTAGIRVAFVIPLADSISISVASGTSGSNPLSSSGESANPCSLSVEFRDLNLNRERTR
jgi:hypothetical protein